MSGLGWPVPIVEIGGFGGAGKTTLLLELVARLRRRGLSPLVVKHDAHGLSVDRRRKDTARLFAAGADVLAFDATQSFARAHAGEEAGLAALLARAGGDHDVVLVEGLKTLRIPHKIWLRRHARDAPPPGLGFRLDLGRDDDRPGAAMARIERWMARAHRAVPVFGAILVGGRSSRMGRPKHLLRHRGETWLARAVAALEPHVRQVVLLGDAAGVRSRELPRLPDAPDAEGPMAGLLSALRWQPAARWVGMACDMPLMTPEGIGWLLGHAAPGVRAVMARDGQDARPEPFPGVYEGRLAGVAARVEGPRQLAGIVRTATPIVPPELHAAWRNVNTPGERRALRGR